jgi:nucleotide-binding universal stress UspA family protein
MSTPWFELSERCFAPTTFHNKPQSRLEPKRSENMGWLPKDKVIVPIDFSDESFAALETASEIVADASHLYAVHVLPVLESAPGVMWALMGDETLEQTALSDLRERTSAAKFLDLHRVILRGDPGREITALAERLPADLIVMPSHGRTGLNRLLIGSVAERVVRLAHCPVLILRH